ncbi:putative Seryl-tRNA synthetase [Monocercomonoides exilis]|uniref:putative Seryl-tRNA synthetase n=1 Tax=Monocercomonoides exilis TaxID=2049356 RepID=UPI00355A61BD|nr:putative Seryl-tRNA synthetase [Monocercomonoides exilis]|eukprot:MONOS_6120.1-p1 / transcript=MONOS_6120.1 / gene=MONOS_6120 / organism=Monocercomonoides_exilis_PA203 / gene_product=Seryl-tRNA synthetase / transcript_product=Seryl-tRNA synthetase / location=Mono_scaffold00188:82593-84422(-) / protein_length=456 / sequence_SO=supercontig / SO=protein_coding / is_pseudo=false
MDSLALDIDLFRKTPEIVRESQERRFKPKEFVDDVISLDEQWRQLRFQLDQKNREKNALDKAIGQKMKAKEDATEMRKQSLDLKGEIEKLHKDIAEIEPKLAAAVNKIGAIVSPIAPASNDENDNKVLRIKGEIREGEGLLSHADLIRMIDGVEYNQARVVAGERGYYLKNEMVLMWMGLQNLGMQFLRKKGFTPLLPPFFMRQEVMQECAQLEQFDEELYKVTGEGDDKYLIATAEQPLSCLHRGEGIHPGRLPLKYAGVSSCFRKEAGSHGKDQGGVFRTHQFEKIEQFVYVLPDKSWEMLEEMISNSEEWNQQLGLAYRVVAIVAGALNNAAAAKYDLEAWFPGSKAFRELVSCSNCVDYQARRLGIKLGQTGGADRSERKYVHMLNATLCAIQRTMCCILETYQTPEGIKVPEVLKPFVGADLIPYRFTKAQVEEMDLKSKKAQAGQKKEK